MELILKGTLVFAVLLAASYTSYRYGITDEKSGSEARLQLVVNSILWSLMALAITGVISPI